MTGCSANGIGLSRRMIPSLVLIIPRFSPLNSTTRQLQLLELPAELRNRIYEYALTDPSFIGLRFRAYLIVSDTIYKPVLLGADGEQFNALKHVCRRLRAETDGLDLVYNVVLIEQVRRDDWAPTKKLFSMVGPNMRSPRPLNIMLVEHLEGEREPWSDTLALADWCALHDNIKTGYVLSEFRCFDDKFLKRWRFPKNFTAWTPKDKENASLRLAKFFGCGVFYGRLQRIEPLLRE
jgi:hypothetical protein